MRGEIGVSYVRATYMRAWRGVVHHIQMDKLQIDKNPQRNRLMCTQKLLEVAQVFHFGFEFRSVSYTNVGNNLLLTVFYSTHIFSIATFSRQLYIVHIQSSCSPAFKSWPLLPSLRCFWSDTIPNRRN